MHVNNGGATPEDILLGYRGALYIGMGLSGLGIIVALAFVFKAHRERRKGLVDNDKASP